MSDQRPPITIGTVDPADTYTVAEVARVFKVHPGTVLVWLQAKKMTGTKLPGGRGWRVQGAEIQRVHGAEIIATAPMGESETLAERKRRVMARMKEVLSPRAYARMVAEADKK